MAASDADPLPLWKEMAHLRQAVADTARHVDTLNRAVIALAVLFSIVTGGLVSVSLFIIF